MKKLGRWILLLVLIELLLAFWVGLRIRDRFEAPLRIIGELRDEPGATLAELDLQLRPTHSTSA